jgi:uncharacterized Tic20 family protein
MNDTASPSPEDSPTPEGLPTPSAAATPPPGGPGLPPGFPPQDYPPPPPLAYPPPAGHSLAPYDPTAPVHPTGPNDTLWAVLSHLSYFVFALIAPLVIMLTVGSTSHFVKRHSTEALNFHISLLIYAVVSAVLIVVIVGFFLLLAVAIFGVVMSIVAAVKAGQGQGYRYPLTIRLVK